MRISPRDPTFPWRREVAGSPSVLIGPQLTALVSSDSWVDRASEDEVVADKVRALCRMCRGGSVDNALSTEVYMSLISRFTTTATTTPTLTTVVGTWDPCGVVQDASTALGLPCVTFLGLSTRMGVHARDVPDLPILGFKMRPDDAEDLEFSIADHEGRIKMASKRKKQAMCTKKMKNSRKPAAPAADHSFVSAKRTKH